MVKQHKLKPSYSREKDAIKRAVNQGRTDGSVVKVPVAPAEDPGLGPSTHIDAPQPSVTPTLWIQCLLLATMGTKHTHDALTYM